jgi:hypothetical protein
MKQHGFPGKGKRQTLDRKILKDDGTEALDISKQAVQFWTSAI